MRSNEIRVPCFFAAREEELSKIFAEIAGVADILVGNEEDFQLCLGIEGPEAGGKQLQRLGTLGHDLGSVSLSELRRIQRARSRGGLSHAELAAQHLAARLRRPEPSFVPVRGGSQRSVGAPPIQGEPSQAHERFNELAEELKQLAQEHAAEVGVVQQVLSEAQHAIDLTTLRQQVQ